MRSSRRHQGLRDVVELAPAGFARVAEIDRSEHVSEVFELAGGELVVRPAAIDDPGWDRAGDGLWVEAERRAREAGAERLLVSSVRAGPSVRFYLRMGCEPAATPHPDLVAREPDDRQLVKPLG